MAATGLLRDLVLINKASRQLSGHEKVYTFGSKQFAVKGISYAADVLYIQNSFDS